MVFFGGLLVFIGLGGVAFGIYAMFRGGRDDDPDEGGLGPIPERGIHILAGVRMLLFGAICLAAGIFAITQLG
ncbi:hypothetical protein [Rubrobacter radiotolerans]|uniref:Uncharacterized protein n=1 Tax=Rubrobacter radiotolerans TaxID=42256 RepID=A0AB35SZH9_RUBRA|nr:hypothetical protein [Rubrobacter radiotolerans]MDX5892900.1 hypothetical protein [Rubrobacter radiotolerans]